MIMATTTIVLLLSSVAYLWMDYRRAQEDLVVDLSAIAGVIVENSYSAVVFDDVRTATLTLASLRANTHIRIACLYKPSGELFAQHNANAAPPCPQARTEDFHEFSNNRLHLYYNRIIDGERVGTLYIRSDLLEVQARLREQMLVVGLLLVLALGVAFALSAGVQALVAQPVVGLSRTAARVSAEGDYSIRAERTTDDELGVLVDAFNRTLERIQLREVELSKANEELRREIVERLRGEKERAELLVREREANRLKDEFLATLSHELRTPLNAILGWTRLLRTNAVPPGGFDRALEKIERNAQVQARLVEDLLEVSRIASGKLQLEIKPFDLSTLANISIDSIRQVAEARGVLIQRQFVGPLPTAGDPDRLQQVIWNLLSNAVKFTPAGGTVTVTLARDGAADVMTVSDTGIGIDPDFLPNVFDSFRQGDPSSTRAHGGLGLGLSIVRNLVQLHGGTVAAESAGPNRGATFTVRLPVRNVDRPRPIRVDLENVEPHLTGVRIVVVDDDADTREMLLAVLNAAGAQVDAAASAEEALAFCLEHQPDALVSDIGMPGQDGYALMHNLQAALGRRAPRVTIALTAFATDRDRERTAEAGYQYHLAKPFDPVALVRLIADLLSRAPSVPSV
jgi:signal transduction histidine kinase/ActR/RegA family two-component response regulator